MATGKDTQIVELVESSWPKLRMYRNLIPVNKLTVPCFMIAKQRYLLVDRALNSVRRALGRTGEALRRLTGTPTSRSMQLTH